MKELRGRVVGGVGLCCGALARFAPRSNSSRRLWPRSFTKGEFTDADLAVFGYLAASTRQDESYVIRVESKTVVS